MTTSGVYSFTCNRDQIIRQAMLNIGKLDGEETPTAQETSDCAFQLNMMIKQWMGKGDFAPGLKIWTRKIGYLFLSGTTGLYSVGPTATGWTNSFASTTTTAAAASGASAVVVSSVTGIVAGYNIGIQLSSGTLQWLTVGSVVSSTVNLTGGTLSASAASGAKVFAYSAAAQQPIVLETANLRDSFSTDTPINIIRDVKGYDALPNKTDPTNISDPTSIYYEFQLGNSNLYTDCGAAQDVTKYLVLRYMEPTQDVTQASDTLEYPQEWYLPLAWGLSSEIAPMFQAAWTPKMEENFKRSLAVAQKKDPEVSEVYFLPGE